MSSDDLTQTRERLECYVRELELVEGTPTSQLTQDERLELHIVLNKGRMVLRAGQAEELVETLRYVRRWRRGFVTRLRQRQAGTLNELRCG
ncbi:MAG: hypothetical protein H6741_23305 [Alphaproteobacteria bacterium]|nr:hypothetical protein [Alphaproteobacteria bacterium]